MLQAPHRVDIDLPVTAGMHVAAAHDNDGAEVPPLQTEPASERCCSWRIGATELSSQHAGSVNGSVPFVDTITITGPPSSSVSREGSPSPPPHPTLRQNPLSHQNSSPPAPRLPPGAPNQPATNAPSQPSSGGPKIPHSTISPRATTLSSLSQQTGPNGDGFVAANAHARRPPAPSHKPHTQQRLFNQPTQAVEAVLAAACEAMNFDIAEVWLRTGPKTHQLTNSHLRPTALDDSVRNELVDVYYGEQSSERTHRLSPALCKRAKEAMDVVWVTAHTPHGAEALRCSISDVRTAVAVPVCHDLTNTNITLIFFSIRRAVMKPPAVEFLVHMSLAAAVSSVNSLPDDVFEDGGYSANFTAPADQQQLIQQQHGRHLVASHAVSHSEHYQTLHTPPSAIFNLTQPQMINQIGHVSVTGASLDLKWSSLRNVEYLTDGGNNWIHTAVMNGRPVVVKTLKPECQDLALAINEIEGELGVHSRLDHPNIVGLFGAGKTSKGSRFVVLERLDGGTLTQMLGYVTRIRDRRHRFWKKKHFTYLEVLRCARSVADAMAYCHGEAIPGCMVLHRDLKPDNIGFTLNGTVKLLDFGLARVIENASPNSDDFYEMSGETGSLRYMAPEVADSRPYNHKADVYSFGIILWEIISYKKPFDGLDRVQFYERVVHGGERPAINKKWPDELISLVSACWSYDTEDRPNFRVIVDKLDDMLSREKRGGEKKKAKSRIASLIDRHSTWF